VVVDLWGRRWTRDELLARVGRLEQLAGVQLAQAGDGAERGVVAMEPSTNRDAGRFDARSRGELQHLAPGEQRHYQLEIGALLGRDAIEEFAARTAALTTSALTSTSGGRT
jgi:hypothetical protein